MESCAYTPCYSIRMSELFLQCFTTKSCCGSSRPTTFHDSLLNHLLRRLRKNNILSHHIREYLYHTSRSVCLSRREGVTDIMSDCIYSQ